MALTFDDGPTPDTTLEVLEILKAHGIKATFFVLGSRVTEWPGIFRRIIEDGHEVGIHGYDL